MAPRTTPPGLRMQSREITRIVALSGCLLLSACASVVRTPLPEELHEDVTVLGREDLRHWGDGREVRILPGITSLEELEEKYGGIMNQEHNYLVISGGGANGAYGAGVLKAWTDLGTRPEFTAVTGVSTGALTAPFAFLGSDYDDELELVYTTLDTTRIIDTRNVFSIFGADSIVDTTPLSLLLEEMVDDEMIAAIAREHQRGRTLSVGTTNMDAGRPVVWNLTRIAASGHPDAPALIRDALLASASIPGAFPPVYIEVEASDGNTYDEMHADGGVTSQMYFYPAGVDWGDVEALLGVQGKPTIWVIRNAYVRPRYKIVQPRLIPIAGHTIDSLIRTQGIGDFFRISTLADRDGLDLEATWIPDEAHEAVGVEPDQAFDPKYMKALFEFGYRRTLEGLTWQDFSEMIEEAKGVEFDDD
ncbi:MAG: patatin-like phospholipase family protein [Pseudomonadota bacterium]